MADLKHFKLPDVGEGLTEADIVHWKVKPGDTVKVNDVLVEIETAKSLVELPSPYAGLVTELLAEEGTTVEVGARIITIDAGDAEVASTVQTPPEAAAPATTPALRDDLVPEIDTPGEEESVEPGLIGGAAPGGRTSVLVGYGPRTTEAKRRPRKGAAAPAATATRPEPTPSVATAEPTAEPGAEIAEPAGIAEPAAEPAADEAAGRITVLAKPPVRKLAKDLGVDLMTVAPTGPSGTISRADVEAAAAGAPEQPAATYADAISPGAVAADAETRIPIRGVRKMTAQAMVASAFTAPHVTEFVTVDVTRSMELVERLKGMREFAEVRVSPLLLVMKALLLAVRRNPEINASWDEDAQEIVIKHSVNLGIAAATGRGLIVPNIKSAERMSLPELGRALGELVETARGGQTAPGDMQGGTITITNVGVFGVDTGTPILNPGEAAILAFGAVRDMPWVVDGQVVPRKVTQLALSFDHRLVDGELGSRFLADIARVLEEPEVALAWS